MSTTDIKELIKNDLETFLYHKSLKENITINNASEIASYVGANFLRIIYAKNKEITKEELNGVFGIISNVYKDLFGDQITTSDFQSIVTNTMELIKDTNFDENSRNFFSNIIQNT